MHPLVQQLQQDLRARANPTDAGPMAKYMKNHFPFLGVKSPARKQVQKYFLKAAVGKDQVVPQEIVEDLWQADKREYQYVAIDLLERYARKGPANYIDWYESLIVRKSWWDSVDGLCNVVWKHFLSHPEQRVPVTERWIDSDNTWLQRTALIFQRKAKAETDWAMLQRYILKTCHSSEFFIQKAIGWALREYSKREPVLVREFVEENRERLAALSIREGSKYL
jgi:3-methyladenine DNA glycosylase AlkD